MYGERKYLVNMNTSFCFESSGACLLSFKLLEDTLLPKVLCSWDSTPGEVFITCICTLKKKWRLTCVIYMYVAYAMSNKNYYFICTFYDIDRFLTECMEDWQRFNPSRSPPILGTVRVVWRARDGSVPDPLCLCQGIRTVCWLQEWNKQHWI